MIGAEEVAVVVDDEAAVGCFWRTEAMKSLSDSLLEDNDCWNFSSCC
jgi:hypothetical protein